MPIGHLGLSVPDLTRARAYYDQVMPAVDFEFFFADDDQFSYRPAAKPGTVLFFYRLDDGRDYSQAQQPHPAAACQAFEWGFGTD